MGDLTITPASHPRRAMMAAGAAMAPSTWDAESRSLEVTVATEAPVRQWGMVDGQWAEYDEVLTCTPDAVDAARLDGGAAPVLTGHAASTGCQIGSVVPGTVRFEGGELIARVALTADPMRAGMVEDIASGLRRSWSVGYEITEYTVSRNAAGRAQLTATRWTPYEVSTVPLPADAGAQSRSLTVPPVRPAEPDGVPAMTTASPVTTPEIDFPARNAKLRSLGRAAGATQAEIDAAIDDAKMTPEAFAVRALELRAAKDVASPAPSAVAGGIEIGNDAETTYRAAIEDSIIARVLGRAQPAAARELGISGRRLLDVGESYLSRRGFRIGGQNAAERAQIVLGVRSAPGMHTSSDFDSVLANVTTKLGLMAYAEQPATWKPLARETTVPDFKAVKFAGLNDASRPTKLSEGGAVSYQTISDKGMNMTLDRYAQGLIFSYQALVNDDLGVFERVPSLFGAACSRKESAVIWALLTNGASTVTIDGGYLIRSANTGALNGAPTAARIGELRAIIRGRNATTADGLTAPLDLVPRFIICNPAITHVIEPLIGRVRADSVAGSAAVAASLAPLAGGLIESPYLGAAPYWVTADPSQIDMIQVIRLAGAEQPQISTELDFDTKGLKLACEHNFAAGVIDDRGFAYNAGA